MSGDNKTTCKKISNANKIGQKNLQRQNKSRNNDLFRDDSIWFEELEQLENLPDHTTNEIAIKESSYREFLKKEKDSRLGYAADLWLGAFLAPKIDDESIQLTPTSENVFLALYSQQSEIEFASLNHSTRLAMARKLCEQAKVLHWPLTFPQVFTKGGFDCVLGNPPWERIKLQEEEFFAIRNRYVAEAKNKAERSICLSN